MGEATPESRPDRPGQPNDAGAPSGAGGLDGAGAPSGAGGLDGAGQQRFFRGVAAVPQRPYADGETGELPLLRKPRSSQEYPLARPVGLRRRWRSLRRGGGWTMAGLWIAVICWGVWAVSVRDGDLIGPAFALGVLLAIGLLIFTVSRLLGRLVLEGMLGRPRPSAWPSHVLVFLLLVVGAVAFLQQTWWVMAAWNWIVGALA